jgi:hypothetical protein
MFKKNADLAEVGSPKGDNQATGSKTIVCFQIKTKQCLHQ